LNPVFPIELLTHDQDEDQVAGHPATFDETFLTQIGNFLETCGEPTADVSDVPFITEAEFLETYLTNGEAGTPLSCSSSLENIPSVVSAQGSAQEETIHDYLRYVPPPSQPQTFSNNLTTPICAPFSIPVNTEGSVVCAPFSINTDGDVPLVVQVAPFPSRSQSVIMQGPVLAARLSTIQAHCRQTIHTSVGSPRGKRVAKTNAKRCEDYRKRQKRKKEEDEEELRMLDAKNRTLKAKEAAISNKVQRMKEALLRMGLGNYINQNL